MPARLFAALAAAALIALASPASASGIKPEPVRSHANLDRMEDSLGLVGLSGLSGLLGLRRRDDRD